MMPVKYELNSYILFSIGLYLVLTLLKPSGHYIRRLL
jgi:hypothetical protein